MDNKLVFHCDMKDVCKSCVLYLPPFQCCYHEFLLTQRECNFARCPFTTYCPHVNLVSFKDKVEQLCEALSEEACGFFKSVATTMPSHFIPEVMPMKKDQQEAMSILRDVDVPIVAVSLQNFFRGTKESILLRRARKSGIHKFLEYSGEIVLTTDVKDPLCDRFVQNVNYFKAIVEQLRPNYLTTLDTYTYATIPAGIARIKMLETQLALRSILDLECKIIGLALGAAPDQIYDYADSLTKLGCRIIAHPVYEFRRKGDTDSIRWRIWLSKKLGAKVLLLSCSPGLTSKRKVYSDYYSSWSWFSSVSSKESDASVKREAKLIKMVELAKKCSKQAKL